MLILKVLPRRHLAFNLSYPCGILYLERGILSLWLIVLYCGYFFLSCDFEFLGNTGARQVAGSKQGNSITEDNAGAVEMNVIQVDGVHK
jgi:hypothetical protein